MTATNIDTDLINLLCCPETRQPLALADAATLRLLNAALPSSAAPWPAALVRADGRRAYPVRDGFPILLVEESRAL